MPDPEAHCGMQQKFTFNWNKERMCSVNSIVLSLQLKSDLS